MSIIFISIYIDSKVKEITIGFFHVTCLQYKARNRTMQKDIVCFTALLQWFILVAYT